MDTVWIIIAVIVGIPVLVMGIAMMFGYAMIIWKSFKEAKRLGKNGKDEYGLSRRGYLWLGFLTLAWVVFMFVMTSLSD